MRKYTFLVFGLLWYISGFSASTPPARYLAFNNLDNKTKALQVRCITQDASGMIWFGTTRGLYSYDGYDVHHHISENTLSRQLIHCCIADQQTLFLGCETGIITFDLTNGKFARPDSTFKENVRALLKYKDKIWIGAETGVYILNAEKKEIRPVDIQSGEMPRSVYSLAADDNYLYVGMMYGAGRYSPDNQEYHKIDFPALIAGAMLLDEAENVLWVGTGPSLIQIDLTTWQTKSAGDFPVVKTLCYDQDGNLLLGTDNGLYVYNKKDGHHHLVHDARNNATLAGDIVWNIFKDRDNNIWLGTDNGISLSTQDQLFKPYFLPSITQSGDGNQILYIRRDFNNSLWLGGTHGIIKIENLESENLTHQWFRMNDSQFPIPHNRIRRIYEDRLQRLWVATDRGLLLYDTIHEHFTNYYLAGDSSNWIYDIIDDSKGDLWIASFNGIYCVNGNIANAKDTLYPRYRYAKKDSLYNNDVYSIAMDSENNLWALVNNSHIDYINLTTRTVHPISQLRNSMNIDADFLFGDSTGRIWISTSNELFRITMNDGEMAVQSARLTNSHSSEVYAMAEVGEELWLTTSEGLFIVHKDTLKVQHIGTTEQYIAIYYDASIHKIWLGTTNKLVMIDPLFTPFSSSPKKIHVTKITINGEQEPDYELYQKESIVLKHNQNNLMISFSDYRYTNEKLMTFSFKLDDVNAQWMKLKGGENSILLPNLAPGNYKVFVTSGQISDEKGQIEPILLITIRPPWYLSLIAKCIYALIAGGLIWWISNFFLVRHRLRIEKEQRQTLIAQAQSKMQFFTNIAHEFKNPLSLIIAPSGKLLSENKKNEEKELLELIHSNALKLSSLIHFSIEAYQDESKIQESFIPSEVEFIEFTRSIFDSFKDSLRYGKQAFLFNANRDKIYVNVDVFKMESVLNNLFANACKYTPENGSITCSLEYDESSSNICIKVTDTGIGIPETELPFVFQRYYQSSRTAKMGFEGTGVGLSIVKDYTEIHKGRIHVISGDTGTTFTVTLPVERDLQHKEKEETHTYEKSMLDEEDNRPLIVIVEDDVSTANFIHEILKKDYRCVIAHNGKNGLKSCIDLQPDLIITDAMMPIMDGLEMCRRIRQHLPLASVPIILLTAKKDPRIEYQSAQLNVDAFISKPFDYSLLQARIIQLIGNKERLKQQVRIEHITNPEMDGEISADEKNLLRITKMIEDNLNDPDLSVDMLCKLSGISSKQLYRKIKQLTNMSTVEYIRSIRLKKAALLFNNGNFTVAEVMYTVGFSNASYFTRSFKAEFGKTPQEYLSGKKNNVMGETKSDSFVQ